MVDWEDGDISRKKIDQKARESILGFRNVDVIGSSIKLKTERVIKEEAAQGDHQAESRTVVSSL